MPAPRQNPGPLRAPRPAAPAPRRAPVVALLLLMVLGAVWLVLGGDALDVLDEPSEPAHTMAEEPEPAALTSTLADDLHDEEGPAASSEEEALQREEVLAFPTDSDGPNLRVIDAASRAPVPFADVFVGESNADWRRRDAGGQHWAERLEQSDAARRTDAKGEVRLPAIRRRLFVVARSGRLFGAGIVGRGEETPVLELVLDRTLRVRVLDAEGQPTAGVPIGLAADLQERVQRVARATTGADGIAVLRHVQLFETRVPQADPSTAVQNRQAAEQVARAQSVLERLRADVAAARAGGSGEVTVELQQAFSREARVAVAQLQQFRQMQAETSRQVQRQRNDLENLRRRNAPETAAWPLAEFVVLAEVPQTQPQLLRFAARGIPEEVVDLRLPAASTIVVELLGPDGAPLQSPCSVALRVSKSSRPTPTTPRGLDDLCVLRADKPLGQSTVEFAPIGLGLRFDLHVRFPDNDFDFQHQDAAGPFATSPHRIVVQTPAWFTVLAGRLVDEQGRVLPGLDPELFVAGARGRVEGERVKLDDAGRFELPLRLRNPSPPYSLEVQATRGELRFGRLIALPELAQGKRTDLGDVVVQELPVLARGTVRDDTGKPLPDVQVVVQVLRGEQWTEESFVRDRTDAEGAFTIYGEPRPLDLRLRASLRRHATEERPVAFGERVELTLMRNGGIRAEGVLPEFVPRSAVLAQLSGADGRPRPLNLRGRPNGGFEVRADDLRPGTWTLRIEVRGLPRPLAVAEQILVQPGEVARPPTIDGLDLRGRLFEYVVRAVDQTGRPMAPGSPLLVELPDRGGQPRLVPFTWRGAEARLVTDQPSMNVVALSTGHGPVRRLLQPGESTLQLRRVHPLHVQLPGLRSLLGPDQAARISLVFAGDTGLPETDGQAVDQRNGRSQGYARAALGKAGGAALGGDDMVRVPLVFNGRYEVVLRVDGPGGRVSKRIGAVDAILDGAEPLTVTVSPDVRAVQDALAELRARPPRQQR